MSDRENGRVKRAALTTSSALALCVCLFSSASVASAQAVTTAPPTAPVANEPAPAASPTPAPASSGNVGEVVVTATRVQRNGYQAPTPTTVVDATTIAESAPYNVANFIDQLPEVQGGTPRSNIASVSAGVSGLNTFNLRNLGIQRTLVLLDGQRVGASTLTDYVDINQFPEELIKRVDVVTGGASADWGSDAVAGVINFVLDRNFTGVKGEVQGGVSTYGDDASYKLNLTAGTGFANDRGHILFAVEDAHNDGITGAPRPWANDANNKLIFANTAPVSVPYGPSIGGAPLSINPNLYDTLGRLFRFGFRFKM